MNGRRRAVATRLLKPQHAIEANAIHFLIMTKCLNILMLHTVSMRQIIFIYQILPISLIFLLVICVRCPRSYCSLCHVNLYVLLTYLLTVGDRAFPVAASRVWNDLPQHVTAAESLPVFCSRLKTHLFRRCFP